MIQIYKVSFVLNDTDKTQSQLDSKSVTNTTNDLKDSLNQNTYFLKICFKDSSHKEQRDLIIRLQTINSPLSNSRSITFSEQIQGKRHHIDLKQKEGKSSRLLIFQLCRKRLHKNVSDLNSDGQEVICKGQIDFNSKTPNPCSIATFDSESRQYVVGSLTFEHKITNPQKENSTKTKNGLQLYIFSLKSFLTTSNEHKRAFVTFNQSNKQVKNDNQNNLKNINEKALIQQSIDQSRKVKKLPVKRIQKGWIWYRDIFQFQLDTGIEKSNFYPIEINIYSYDFNSGEKCCIGTYRGPLFIDFNSPSEIKFTQFQLIDQQIGGEDCSATIQFKYCLKSESNLKKANDMTSKTYLQNAFSPSKFVYDNSSFVSNTAVAKDKTSKKLDFSTIKDSNNLPLLNLNKMNRNVFVRSKFHSVFSSNSGISFDREQRFFSPNKKLTDQLGYYAHKTLDINQLPKSEKYRYASFGRDTKECLKLNAFDKMGPGSARYQLPSVFDKY